MKHDGFKELSDLDENDNPVLTSLRIACPAERGPSLFLAGLVMAPFRKSLGSIKAIQPTISAKESVIPDLIRDPVAYFQTTNRDPIKTFQSNYQKT